MIFNRIKPYLLPRLPRCTSTRNQRISSSAAALQSSQHDHDWRRTIALKTSYLSCPGAAPLSPLTLGRMVDASADRHGDREAFVSVHQGVRKTFHEFRAEADRLAAGLVALGMRRGERIGIWGPNSYEWCLTLAAAAKAGLVLVNINPAYQPGELKYCLNKVGVKAIVSSEFFKTQDYYSMLTKIAPEIPRSPQGQIESEDVPSLKHVIMLSQKKYGGAHIFEEVLRGGGSDDVKVVAELGKQIQMDDLVNIQFTSGTTGNPKGACLSHHNILNNGIFVGHRINYDEKPHRLCLPVPLYHCFGLVCGVLSMLSHGGTCVFPSYTFEARPALETVQNEKCTSMYGTPTMFVDMVKLQQEARFDLSSLHTGIMAGAPCPRDLCEQTIRHLNMKDFVIAYGLTETSPVSFMSFPDDSDELTTTTIGFPLDHVEVKVVDPEGKVVPPGERGELCSRGYSTMLGYWGDEEKTREAVTPDRWFHTGDQAVLHENGYAQIVGRMKEMVIRGGENIYPREIEETLHTHPDIIEAQVIGIPDKRLGEDLCAWIRASKDLSEEDVKGFCKGKIAHFKIPRYVLFVDSFPVTVTGKVQKFKMREESVKMLGLEQAD